MDWLKVNNFLEESLKKVSDTLDNDAIDSIKHYMQHDEYEMAYEGLFLEIMKNAPPPGIDFEEGRNLGKKLSLDKHSSFDENFWKKFENYIEKNTNE